MESLPVASTADLSEGIYRAMEEEYNMPKLGMRAVNLGVRMMKDIPVDNSGMVHRSNFQPGNENGLSCAPTIHSLPLFALPVEWGGSNKRTVVWKIDVSDLGADVEAREDSVSGKRRHVSIGPTGTMSFDDYLAAIHATQPHWRKIIKAGG